MKIEIVKREFQFIYMCEGEQVTEESFDTFEEACFSAFKLWGTGFPWYMSDIQDDGTFTIES